MRYHLVNDDEESDSSSSYTIWSTGTPQSSSILKTIHNPNGLDENFLSESFSNLYSLDSGSPSQKRKILDCEKGDFEERFRKIQRKKQLQKVAAKANLVVDDDESESDDEDEIYEQMDWIEKENEAVNLHSWDSSDDEEDYENDDDEEDINSNTSVLFLPRLKWKEERRRLLRISMAKIRRVEDPESYLRRSVLINNTVKRLQKDVSMNLPVQSTSNDVSYQNEDNWEVNDSGAKPQNQFDTSFGVDYSSMLNSNAVVHFNERVANSETSSGNPVHFQLALTSNLSPDKVFEKTPQDEISHNSTFNKSSVEEQKLSEVSSVISKPLHLFPSQPCGLQYRSVVQDEEAANEYSESSKSTSILDSVVYHSLVASLET